MRKSQEAPLEQAYLLFAEHDRLALGLFLQPQQPLAPMREIVPEPDPAYALVLGELSDKY